MAKNVVLVHGAWADGSSWGAVIERLQKAKYSGDSRAQHMFSQRMGATVSSIAGSHVPMVSHRDEVAALITKASREKPRHAAN
jgi:hypothetical protein